ncbi:MAG: amidohydrolase [Oscillospiraceae bacterium]|nr:amidohydrolase [Oscillospiraceae bacterium]
MDKKLIYATVDAQSSNLTALSDRIWEYAELSMMEHRSTAAYLKILKDEGFEVKENLCGMATAFSGTYGTGKPVIGILGEYDALSGLSQVPGITEKQPLVEGGCGQGCGHNLLGAASLGAAIAIKEAIQAGHLNGTVVFYGCPGEEGCAGKTFMARDGQFRNLDAALTWHPGDVNEVTTGSNAASIQVEYSFTGIASHAAGNPAHGRSALDAAELMNVGVQFLREHMESKCSVHYSFADAGGLSPNVVQPTAKLIYMVRGENVRKAKALLKRVNKIAQGAALMTETEVTWRQIDGTSSTVSNEVLEQLLYENLKAAPLPQYSEEEITFAAALRTTYHCDCLPGTRTEENRKLRTFVAEKTNNGKTAINNFVMPYYPSSHFSPGSSDVGDVSWLTPTAQFNAVTWPSGCPGHSWQNVSAGKTSFAHKGIVFAAKALAGAVADLMEDPEILRKARAEFRETTAEGYDCPISKDIIPTIG